MDFFCDSLLLGWEREKERKREGEREGEGGEGRRVHDWY